MTEPCLKHDWQLQEVKVVADNPRFNHHADYILKQKICTKCKVKVAYQFTRREEQHARN